MVTADGYMIECSWDGQALRVHATTKVASIALVGENRGEDLVLTRDHIASVAWKGASSFVYGKISIRTVAGAQHQLHFRRKHGEGMERLYTALQEAAGTHHTTM
jgi:hypothetical protein